MNQRIIVDADACPVKQEIIHIGQEFRMNVIFVASFAHYMSSFEGAKIIYVDQSDQSVDLHIANMIQPGDIIITDDYGLAAILLKPYARVLSFRGSEYSSENIQSLLASRHESSKMRRGGHKTKGPKPFMKEDRENFVESLRKILNS